MRKKKKVTKYRVKWSMGCCPLSHDVPSECHGTITVDAQDVEDMTDEQRQDYFSKEIDEEVRINGPCGHVDSVDEVEGE